MNTAVEKVLKTNAGYGPLPIRLGLGIVMIAHGAQKLFGWFGGYGLEATGQFFETKLSLSPGYLMALLAGGGEFFGGILVLIGLLTRPFAAILGFTMIVGIATVHPDAFFVKDNGMEFALTLLFMSVALVISGGGSLSIDQKLAQGGTAS